MLNDLRYAFRMLLKNPGFTAVAVSTLALGIGANTAIFSVIDAGMLRKLPVRNPQDLIQLATVGRYGVSSFSHPAYKRFRDQNHVCSEMAAIGWLNKLDASINGQPETVEGRIASGNFFSLLGVGAAIGRTFTIEDDSAPLKIPVAVISYAYWKRRFGLDPSVVGKSITLNRTPFTIVGVAAAGFSGPEVGYSPDLYVPMMMEPAFHDEQSWLDQLDYHWLRIMGRLKPGVSREQARANLEGIHSQILAGRRIGRDRNRLRLAQGVLTDIVYSDGHGSTGIADRLRECCQSVARASVGTTEGDRRTPGHWSRAFSTDSPISHRKRNARNCRGRPWPSLCLLGRGRHRRPHVHRA